MSSRTRLSHASYAAVVGIVEALLAQPGVYVGTDTMPGTDRAGAARIVVAALPGGAGVSLDYEVLAGPSLAHVEHTVIGTADDGTAVMVIAHTHGERITILRESQPGVFEPGDGPVPYPMKVVVSVPEPGRLRHAWWYGSPGADPVERDVAVVERVA